MKSEVSKDQVSVEDIIHLHCLKNKRDFNDHAAAATSVVAGPTAQGAAAATSAAAVASPLAAAFNASSGVVGVGSKDKPVDIEQELEAVLEAKEAADSLKSSAL